MELFTCRPRWCVLLGLTAVLTVLTSRPTAAVGRRLDLATITARAGTIVAGRIVQLQPGAHPKYPNVGVLYVTVQVSDMLKGAPTDRLTFMQFAGRAASSMEGRNLSAASTLPDLPSYRVGEEVVLFLYPASSAGFTSPVGAEQGKFLVRRPQGQPATVVADDGTVGLPVHGPLPSRLSPAQQELLHHPGAVLDYKTFRATITALARGKK